LRDNLDENGSGSRSVKRRPVAKRWSCGWLRFARIFVVAAFWLSLRSNA